MIIAVNCICQKKKQKKKKIKQKTTTAAGSPKGRNRKNLPAIVSGTRQGGSRDFAYKTTPTPTPSYMVTPPAKTHMGINGWDLDLNTKTYYRLWRSKLLNQSWIICNAAPQSQQVNIGQAIGIWNILGFGVLVPVLVGLSFELKAPSSLTDFSNSMGHLAHIESSWQKKKKPCYSKSMAGSAELN